MLISQNDDMTFGALDALRAAGRSPESGDDMIILSFDGTRKALELVESGVIYADLECNPQQGEYLEEVIQKLEAGQEIERIYYVPEKIFTRDNVSRYIEGQNLLTGEEQSMLKVFLVEDESLIREGLRDEIPVGAVRLFGLPGRRRTGKWRCR